MSQPRSITLYLHLHQPFRLREYSVFDTAERHDYFSTADGTNRDNRVIFQKVAAKSYRPMNDLLENLLATHAEFKLSLSISGTFLEQAEMWAPDVIEQLQRMVSTGRVEILAETYYHSLAFYYSRDEFETQVKMHRQRIEKLFGVTPRAFRNTELAYDDSLALWAEQNGYQAIIAEGWDKVLDWRSPNYVYQPAGTENIKLLLKNYRLSDDIAFRFSNKAWGEWPLTADKYTKWIDSSFGDKAPLVNLFMDYETFGEHQWEATGIFNFFETFVGQWLSDPSHGFMTVSEAAASHQPAGQISMPETVTWADSERDLSAWMGNSLQREALRHIYALEADVLRTGDIELIDDWRKLLISDHTYYMSTKWLDDGNVHAYFSPYDSPYDGFLYYMNAVRDIRYRLMHYLRFGGF